MEFNSGFKGLKKLCIKLVSIKELYYDARPTKSQDSHGIIRFPPDVFSWSFILGDFTNNRRKRSQFSL